jgi:hypothetical protein
MNTNYILKYNCKMELKIPKLTQEFNGKCEIDDPLDFSSYSPQRLVSILSSLSEKELLRATTLQCNAWCYNIIAKFILSSTESNPTVMYKEVICPNKPETFGSFTQSSMKPKFDKKTHKRV